MREIQITAPCYALGKEFVDSRDNKARLQIRSGEPGTIVVQMPDAYGERRAQPPSPNVFDDRPKACGIYFKGKNVTVVFDDMTVWFLTHPDVYKRDYFILVGSSGQNPLDDNTEYPEIKTRLYGVIGEEKRPPLCIAQAADDGEHMSGGLIVTLKRFNR